VITPGAKAEVVEMSDYPCPLHADFDAKVDVLSGYISGQKEQIRTVFDQLKQLNRKMDELPDKLADKFEKHEKNCPAHVKAMRRATNGDSDKSINVQSLRDEIKGEITRDFDVRGLRRKDFDTPAGIMIPKWVIYLSAGIGIAVVAAVIALGKVFF
jgi:hypothetical protein